MSTWISGDTWRPLDEWVVSPNRDTLTPVGNALACGSIGVVWGAAADGSQDEVWVGTGEANTNADAYYAAWKKESSWV